MPAPDEGRDGRHARGSKKNAKGTDGWIAATVHVIAKTYGWSFREIFWEVPLSALMLLRRQENLANIMPLSIIEKMDNGQ